MEIRQVRKSGVQKIVTIPKKSAMVIGDFVFISKVFPGELSPGEMEARENKRFLNQFEGEAH